MNIENYSNYLIYNNGDVYSIKRKKFLKPRFDKDGYKRVDLKSDEKKATTFTIHKLVALCYLDFKPAPDLTIDHIDHDILNNYLHNLQVITRSQNSRRKIVKKKSGLMKGVYRLGQKFKSYITINKKKMDLGLFNTEIEAHEAYMVQFNKLMEGCII